MNSSNGVRPGLAIRTGARPASDHKYRSRHARGVFRLGRSPVAPRIKSAGRGACRVDGHARGAKPEDFCSGFVEIGANGGVLHRGLEQLRGVDVSQAVGGEIPDQPEAPVDVLQAALPVRS